MAESKGLITYWRLIDELDRDKLYNGLKLIGLEHYITDIKTDKIFGSKASLILKDLIKIFSVVELNNSGIYWLPAYHSTEWQTIANVFMEAASVSSSVYLIEHEMDQKASLAIRDALTREVEDEFIFLKDKNTINQLRNKVYEYERILGLEFIKLREDLNKYEN